MKKKTTGRYTVLQNSIYILKYTWSHDKSLLFIIFASALASVFLPLSGIYLPKILLGQIEIGATQAGLIRTMGVYTLMFMLLFFVSRYLNNLRYWKTNQLRTKTLVWLFFKTLRCDYSIIESADGQAKYQMALNSLDKGDWSGIPRIIIAICGLITGVLGFFLYSAILISLHWSVILLLSASSLVNYYFQKKAREYEHANKDNWALYDKRLSYFSSSSSDFSAGKDIRMYSMKKWFLSTRDHFLKKRMMWVNKVENSKMLSKIVNILLIFIRDGLAYTVLIVLTVRGDVRISDFVLFFGAIAGFSSWITSVIGHSSRISEASLQVCDTRSFMDIKDGPSPEDAIEIDKSGGISIEFRNVSFEYESSKPIFNNLEVKINPGEKIALVGRNGAGKTTFIKLSCGLYKPNSGEILLNGVNIERINNNLLFEIFAPVFQDIMILPLTIAENIALDDRRIIDQGRVMKCLENAGLLDDIMQLPDNIDTVLYKVIDDKGIELSGGQQQKLLLARALYKEASVLILDEPTAALDPIAESEMYNKYHDFASSRTAVFISHRLASTLFCDRIFYMDEGIITENGTHQELMDMNGDYARMFELQSHYYKDDFEGEGSYA